MSRPTRVPILSLTPYEGNARRGNVPVIEESLRVNGQYRTILVRESDSTILAGNHTWQAARSLGFTEVDVTWISCDDDTARRIVLADNRLSDLASYDDDALLTLLRSLPDLSGTGFAVSDLDRLDGLFSKPSGLDSPKPEPEILLEVGQYRSPLDPDIHLAWSAALIAQVGEKKRTQVSEIRKRLALPTEARAPKKSRPTPSTPEGVGNAILAIENEPIGSLIPYPQNAREGDIGAITESIRALGVYRPITANRRTREILVGNHTWFAATRLGLTEIAVSWVDVDEEAAKRIVLADNRTSDLAFYHDGALEALLTSLPNLAGTGFSLEDLDEIRTGGSGRSIGSARVYIQVGTLRFSLAEEVFRGWAQDLPTGREIYEIVERLGLPRESLASDY